METKVKYKAFLKMSKHVVGFSKLDFPHRLMFYMEAPFRYLKFKRVLAKDMQGKVEKKEV